MKKASWKETVVYVAKLLLIKAIVYPLDKRDEYRIAMGKDPILPR